jgi:hypothetical protein
MEQAANPRVIGPSTRLFTERKPQLHFGQHIHYEDASATHSALCGANQETNTSLIPCVPYSRVALRFTDGSHQLRLVEEVITCPVCIAVYKTSIAG